MPGHILDINPFTIHDGQFVIQFLGPGPESLLMMLPDLIMSMQFIKSRQKFLLIFIEAFIESLAWQPFRPRYIGLFIDDQDMR